MEAIALDLFCKKYEIDITFVVSLHHAGLIDIFMYQDECCILLDQIPKIEKCINLYYKLDINIEGIETIDYLLCKIIDMQQEINRLNNLLCFYE